jgi:hypothetical protein
MANSTQQETVKTSFDKKIGSFQVSHEYTQLQIVAAKTSVKTKILNGLEVKTTIFKEINKAKTDVLKATLTSSDLGQQLAFSYQRGGNEEDAKDQIGRILATFTMTKDFKMSMVSNHEFNAINSYVFKPLITAFPGIEGESISDVFSQWLCTSEFFEHLKIVSSKKGYTPALVKMLVLYISYQDVKDEVGTQTGQFTNGDIVDINAVARVFKANIAALQSSVPKMAKHYSTDLMLAPTQSNVPEPAEQITSDAEDDQRLVEEVNQAKDVPEVALGDTEQVIPDTEEIIESVEANQAEDSTIEVTVNEETAE